MNLNCWLIRGKRAGLILACLASAQVVGAQAGGRVKLENAASPDQKYILEAVADTPETCRIEVKSKSDGKVVGQFSIADYYAHDSRYSISAVWTQEAFALNIEFGRNLTGCRIFCQDHGSWKEVSLPDKEIDKVRQKANKPGGKEQEYLQALAWLPKNKVKLAYFGNRLGKYELVYRFVRAGKPHLEYVETIPPKPPPEPKYDYENYVFTVLAGGTAGSRDGVGAAAQFKGPHGVAVDAAGNVFVADRGNHLIRKITPSGAVSTLAGSAEKFGHVDGIGGAARFWYPMGMAVDASDNVYVADSSSHTIRKVTPDGAVSTLAGSPDTGGSARGIGGYASGSGTAAYFNNPTGVSVDKKGTVYVADSNNQIIRKITVDGAVTTVAGSVGSSEATDGDAKSARFASPSSVAVDGKGNLYVADKLTIRKINARGVVSTLAGSPDRAGSTDGVGSAAQFSNPRTVAVDAAGNVYVADDGNKNIRKITPAGVVKTLRDARHASPFIDPVAVAADEKGRIYVSDEDGFSIIMGKPAK